MAWIAWLVGPTNAPPDYCTAFTTLGAAQEAVDDDGGGFAIFAVSDDGSVDLVNRDDV